MAIPIELLLIEDNPADAGLVRESLRSSPLPVNVTIAEDGERALELLKSVDFKPSLVLLDLNIPRIDGLTLLERCAVKAANVVVFCSSSMQRDIDRALALGAKEYVQKPGDLQAYITAVCGIVEKWCGA
ncbi:MAG: response regulator [Acidobacteriota bacterium]|nr:response regulator [Acidobacteriota bacterium]